MTNGVEINLLRNLEDWTYESIVDIVRKFEFEPGIFDYKAVLNATNHEHRNDHNASIRRTACSMANADGGYILFGIRDRNQPVNSPDERIVGMPLGSDLRKSFADKLLPFQRPIYFEASPRPIVLPTNTVKGIFVVYIPQSPLRPHMDESTGIFYRRGEGGNADIMKFYEVREQMMYTEERQRKVTLFRLKLAQYRELAHKMQITSPVTEIYYRFDTGAFDILLADICGLLPESTGLLLKLLEIPIMANAVNEFLARPTHNYIPNDISSNLTDIWNKGLECENQLEQIFGPLPIDNQ